MHSMEFLETQDIAHSNQACFGFLASKPCKRNIFSRKFLKWIIPCDAERVVVAPIPENRTLRSTAVIYWVAVKELKLSYYIGGTI